MKLAQILGILTFLGALAWTIVVIYVGIEDDYYNGVFALIHLTCVIAGIYVLLTRFGKDVKDKEVVKIEKENLLLKMRIEQKELQKKLEK